MKYDLSNIMKKAHSFYKTGKYTWSECLKKSWKMAKFSVWVKETKEDVSTDYKAEADKKYLNQINSQHGEYKPAKRSSYDSFNAPISAYYTNNNIGRFGSCFVGD